MTQSCLNRAVAKATGETLATVRRMGFSILEPAAHEDESGPAAPHIIDWDAVDAQRVVLFPLRQSRAA